MAHAEFPVVRQNRMSKYIQNIPVGPVICRWIVVPRRHASFKIGRSADFQVLAVQPFRPYVARYGIFVNRDQRSLRINTKEFVVVLEPSSRDALSSSCTACTSRSVASLTSKSDVILCLFSFVYFYNFRGSVQMQI